MKEEGEGAGQVGAAFAGSGCGTSAREGFLGGGGGGGELGLQEVAKGWV